VSTGVLHPQVGAEPESYHLTPSNYDVQNSRKKKVKSLCLIKHYAMKAYGEVDV
jgi:hypothetical protein